MAQKEIRIIFLEEALTFIGSIRPAARKKIYYNMDKVLFGERDSELFKNLGDTEIWEFRTLYDKTAYCLSPFGTKTGETFVVSTHGIVKKSQKTPEREIEKAERLRKEYFNEKNRDKT